MKKAITILAILIVLVSAVFADETHKLKIKATQVAIPPAFQMYVKSVSQTGATATSTIVTNGSNPAGYGVNATEAQPNALYDETASDAAVFSFETANTVTVAVKLGNAAKTAQNYSLSFSDGIFSVSRNGASQYQDGTKVINEGTEQEETVPNMVNYTVSPESKTVSAGTNSNASNGFVTTPSGATATVDFNGTTCTSGHEVATCAYAYAAHTEVDPGTYTADVILTITTTN